MADEAPDTGKTDAENQANAEAIIRVERTEHGARGNTQSEPDAVPVDQDAPPPLPN